MIKQAVWAASVPLLCMMGAALGDEKALGEVKRAYFPLNMDARTLLASWGKEEGEEAEWVDGKTNREPLDDMGDAQVFIKTPEERELSREFMAFFGELGVRFPRNGYVKSHGLRAISVRTHETELAKLKRILDESGLTFRQPWVDVKLYLLPIDQIPSLEKFAELGARKQLGYLVWQQGMSLKKGKGGHFRSDRLPVRKAGHVWLAGEVRLAGDRDRDGGAVVRQRNRFALTLCFSGLAYEEPRDEPEAPAVKLEVEVRDRADVGVSTRLVYVGGQKHWEVIVVNAHWVDAEGNVVNLKPTY
jgi:hypothetical protein